MTVTSETLLKDVKQLRDKAFRRKVFCTAIGFLIGAMLLSQAHGQDILQALFIAAFVTVLAFLFGYSLAIPLEKEAYKTELLIANESRLSSLESRVHSLEYQLERMSSPLQESTVEDRKLRS